MRIGTSVFAVLVASSFAVSAAADDDTCPAGNLGSVQGTVSRFVSDGSSVFFVAQSADGTSRLGVLGPNGTSTTLSEDAGVARNPLAAVEGGVATVAGDEIRFWNANGQVGPVDTAATDGLVAAPFADSNGLLHWYEQDRRYGTSFSVWNGSTVTSVDAPSNFEGGSFVTDGTSYFGAFASSSGGHSIGKLATSGESEIAFATVQRPGAAFAFVGIDADDVYYVLQTDDGIVHFAGSDKATGATIDYGAKLGILATRPLVVRRGFAYVEDATVQDPTALVTRWDLTTGDHWTVAPGPAEGGGQVAGSLVADACGIVYSVRRNVEGALVTDFVRIAP